MQNNMSSCGERLVSEILIRFKMKGILGRGNLYFAVASFPFAMVKATVFYQGRKARK